MGSSNFLRSRRSVVALVAASTLGVVLTGCSGASSNSTDQGRGSGPVKDPSKPVTVTFQSWVGSDPTLKKMAADFHKLHPNITIKMLNVSADSASQKLTTQVAGGNPPDVAYVDASDTSDFASAAPW